jgi:hypothetical protein
MNIHTTPHSVLHTTGVALAAGAVGLVGLPLAFGRLPEPALAFLWLAIGVVDCVCLLLPTRAFESAIAQLIARLPGRGQRSASSNQQATQEIARLIVAAAYLVLVQAILRHPLVAVLGTDAEPFLVEALLGILALLVLLVLLSWIYRAARPLLEGVAWVALDATFATSESEEATRAAAAMTQPSAPTHTAEPAVTARG